MEQMEKHQKSQREPSHSRQTKARARKVGARRASRARAAREHPLQKSTRRTASIGLGKKKTGPWKPRQTALQSEQEEAGDLSSVEVGVLEDVESLQHLLDLLPVDRARTVRVDETKRLAHLRSREIAGGGHRWREMNFSGVGDRGRSREVEFR